MSRFHETKKGIKKFTEKENYEKDPQFLYESTV